MVLTVKPRASYYLTPDNPPPWPVDESREVTIPDKGKLFVLRDMSKGEPIRLMLTSCQVDDLTEGSMLLMVVPQAKHNTDVIAFEHSGLVTVQKISR